MKIQGKQQALLDCRNPNNSHGYVSVLPVLLDLSTSFEIFLSVLTPTSSRRLQKICGKSASLKLVLKNWIQPTFLSFGLGNSGWLFSILIVSPILKEEWLRSNFYFPSWTLLSTQGRVNFIKLTKHLMS